MQKIDYISGCVHTRLTEFPYQGESGDGEHRFEAAVDEERAEQPQAVVPQVFERQLEDVSPADAAEVDLLRRPVRGAAQRQELWVRGFDGSTTSGRCQKEALSICVQGNGCDLTMIMAKKAKPMRTLSTLMSSMERGSFFSTVVLKPGIMPVMFAPAEHRPTTRVSDLIRTLNRERIKAGSAARIWGAMGLKPLISQQ